MNKVSTRVGFYASAGLLLLVLSYVRYSFGIGSYYCTFSGVSLAPLLGAFFGITGIGFSAAFYSLFSSLLKGGMFIPFSKTAALPTLISSFCFFSSLKKPLEAALYLGVPSLMFALFFIHPEGHQAWYYGLYWTIPMAIYAGEKLFSYKSLFTTSLASTFIAHALGSVIYLYSFNITAGQWTALIPVVAAERLLIASTMTLAIYAIKAGFSLMHGIAIKNLKIS